MSGLATSTLDPSDWIAIAAAAFSSVVGLVALWLSFRANKTSVAAQNLAQLSYDAERRIALTSSVTDDYLLLAPVGAEQVINSITLFFPRQMGIAPITLAGGEFKLFHTRIAADVRTEVQLNS